jgi:hypothetical protein
MQEKGGREQYQEDRSELPDLKAIGTSFAPAVRIV